MSKVKRPRIKGPVHTHDEDDAPQAPVGRGAPDGNALREKVASYAFGTMICGAAMVALAAWMGGSLGAFGKRLDNGFTVIMRSAGLSVGAVQVVPQLDPVLERKVREAAAIEIGDNMFSADPFVIRKRVESIDAVGSVSVFRLWPDQITISADPRKPVALWQEGGDWRVIDQRGRIFAQAMPGEYLHLPRIAGDKGADSISVLISALSDYPDLSGRMETARRVGERRWDVTFKGGVEVALPEDDMLPEALAAVNLMHAHNRILDLPVTRVDARRPDRLALRPIAGGPAPGGA